MKHLRQLLALLALALPAYQAHADCVLREDTASQEVALPRFVDSTDGVTAETGLTIANTDIKLTKSGGTTQVNKNSGGATHIATGDYYTVLDATDTDTVGNLHIVIGVSGALPVWVDCLVVEEAIYDAVYAASATGAHPVSSGGIAAAAFASGAIDAAAIAADAIGSSELATDAIGAAELAANAVGAAEIADGAIDGATFSCPATAGSMAALGIVDCGTAQAATGTTLQLRSAATFADSELIGATCLISGGSAGVGQSRTVTAYTSATDTATVATWTTTPTGTITYVCFGTSSSSGSVSIAAGGITAASFGTGAIDATAIAADAIGSSELAANSIGASELADDAIDSGVIATDAIGAAEIAASAIGTNELADGGITSAEFASGAITATVVATDAIGAAEVATDAVTEVQSGLSTLNAAGVRTAVGLASANLDTQISAIPTAVRDVTVEDQGTISLGCALASILAINAGDVATTGGNSTFKDHSNAETRVTSIVMSAGNRTVTITCPSY